MSYNQEMFCHQCQMSAPEGCGAKGQDRGTCGKTSTLALLQDTMVFGLKGLSAYRHHAHELGADTKRGRYRYGGYAVFYADELKF